MEREQEAVTRWSERGSFSIELAVLAPVLLVVISFIISVGRVTEAGAQVQGAARDAARAATINHNGNAEAAALDAYQQATRGRDCDPLVLNPRAPVPGGTVTATASCRVTAMWGRQTITRQASSAVDIYRGTN